jgi:hypothetical protein
VSGLKLSKRKLNALIKSVQLVEAEETQLLARASQDQLDQLVKLDLRDLQALRVSQG